MGNRELARWLKALDAMALACCVGVMLAVVPARCAALAAAEARFAGMVAAGWAFVVLAAVPIVGVAVLAWRIFGDIGAGESFSAANAARLKRIGFLAVVEAALFAACIAALAVVGALADGLLAVLLVAVVASGGLGVVGFALSHLTANAAAIKAENDLTV